MLHRRYKLPLLFIAFLLYSSMASAALTPVNFSGQYGLYLSGLPIGTMKAGVDVRKDGYDITAAVRTSGLVGMIARHRSNSSASASGQNINRMNVTYLVDAQTRNKKRTIKLVKHAGKVTEEVINPPENRASRPEVPAAMKDGTFDAISIVLKLRSLIEDWKKNGDDTAIIRLYDGRRLSEAAVTIHGEKKLRKYGEKAVIALSIKRKPLEGFTQKELSQYRPDEPALTIYFSNDDKLIPLHLELPFTFGTLTAEME
ncbi:MAG: DUF3108 domain-containing protein [Alphaproteobacteria bacterium]|nr:DUF3108 domain-containing protein [Alphaproteobacteria bacterium]